MFVARERELILLREAYESPSFEFVPVYGRRRVGKTALINEFVKDKPAVFFYSARKSTGGENLALLSQAIHRQLGTGWERAVGNRELLAQLEAQGLGRGPLYQSCDDALQAIFQAADEASKQGIKPIIVIDEYPYLAKGEIGAASSLQVLIDHYASKMRALFILCGSSMSYMEHQVLGEKSPLYGRRTRQLKVAPMDVFDARRLFPGIEPRRMVELYGMAGGIPLYLDEFDGALSTEENMARALLSQGALLSIEPANFLLQEVRDVGRFNAVLGALAQGRTHTREIADATGLQPTNVVSAMDALIELSIVRRLRPVGGRRSRRYHLYRIVDPLFRFWYRFVGPNQEAIEAGAGPIVARRVMDQEFPTFMGPVFEDVCRQWLMRELAAGRVFDAQGQPTYPLALGSWWGTDLKVRAEAEIDIVGECAGPIWLVGECRWRNEKTDVGLLEKLAYRAELVGESAATTERRLYAFSRSPFTRGAQELAARDPRMRLVTLDELFAG